MFYLSFINLTIKLFSISLTSLQLLFHCAALISNVVIWFFLAISFAAANLAGGGGRVAPAPCNNFKLATDCARVCARVCVCVHKLHMYEIYAI